MSADYWLDKQVEARFVSGGLQGVGRVVGYLNEPHLLIEAEGKQFWWVAALCKPYQMEPAIGVMH